MLGGALSSVEPKLSFRVIRLYRAAFQRKAFVLNTPGLQDLLSDCDHLCLRIISPQLRDWLWDFDADRRVDSRSGWWDKQGRRRGQTGVVQPRVSLSLSFSNFIPADRWLAGQNTHMRLEEAVRGQAGIRKTFRADQRRSRCSPFNSSLPPLPSSPPLLTHSLLHWSENDKFQGSGVGLPGWGMWCDV